MGVFPFGQYPTAPHRIKAGITNKILKKDLTKLDGNLTFLDITSKQVLPNGEYNPELCTKDFVHLSDKGYDLWAGEILPIIKKYVK
jgi:lysophospholipase L1-like esterase